MFPVIAAIAIVVLCDAVQAQVFPQLPEDNAGAPNYLPDPPPEPDPPMWNPPVDPTPIPPPESCPFYYANTALIGGAWDTLENPVTILQPGRGISCLRDFVDYALGKCGDTSSAWYDNCVLETFWNEFTGGRYVQAGAYGPQQYMRYHFFDESCNSIQGGLELLNDACEALRVEAIPTPLSLIWESGADIEQDPTIVSFPVNPHQAGKSYLWKASAATPLLVYDPAHSGQITSPYQLFGEWTFGGKQTARVAQGMTDTRTQGANWQNGFEALASLDANGDREISDSELQPLALWFDVNRDGISQQGEVQSLAVTGVVALYYEPDRVDPLTKSIHASKGYLRRSGGRVTTGPSVDWFAKTGQNHTDLAHKILTENTICDLGSRESESADVLAQNNAGDGLTLWHFSILGNDRKLHDVANNEGVMLLQFDTTEKVSGWSFAEAVVNDGHKWSKRLNSMIAAFSIDGTVDTGTAGKKTLSFYAALADGEARTENWASMSADGMNLNGRSKAHIASEDGTTRTFTYQWRASRVTPLTQAKTTAPVN